VVQRLSRRTVIAWLQQLGMRAALGLLPPFISYASFFALQPPAERLHNMALPKRIIPHMFSKLLVIASITVLLASAADVPPKSLVRENIKKATVIVKGMIETSNAPRTGITVANFRVSECYRGPFKPGDVISYASFREGDRYSSEYLHTNLIVFLRKRSSRFAPPDWETATDLSEFPPSSGLESMLPKRHGSKHR
jgi:hypothetical protein